ncbi:MAG: ubiquitin-like protein Pup [Candidatus Nanopelagicales bacterium]|nr:ubiquitin-like protein Pup [Candidatus Nanopelagicales bacterium]
MPGQENIERKAGHSEHEPQDDATPSPSRVDAEHKAALDADVDALLDEIDDVLEVNAEQFVKSFVQKGGQ